MKKALIGAEIDKKVLTVRQFVIKNMLCLYVYRVCFKKKESTPLFTDTYCNFQKNNNNNK